MRPAVFATFALLFTISIASSSLAKGLEITQIEARVDYDESYVYSIGQAEHKSRINYAAVPVANGSKINVDVLPGSNLTFSIRVENTFQGKEPDLRKIVVTITIEGKDDGTELEEKSIDFDLEPGNDNRVDVKFKIPLDVESGTHNVMIKVEGEDTNRTSYKTEVKLKLGIGRLSHDIRITKVLLNPRIIDCTRKSKLTAQIMNVGSSPESEIAMEFKSGALGINSFDRDISLEASSEANDEERTHTKTINIEVPSFLKSGAYPILVNLYWKNLALFDQKTVDLSVRDCGSSGTKKEPEKDIKNKTEIGNAELLSGTKEIGGGLTPKVSISKSPALLLIFSGGLLILFIILILIFTILKRNKMK